MQEFYLDENLFNLWNDEKKRLNRSARPIYPKIREVWYIKIGMNVGKEIFGKRGFFRPVLVISRIGNMFFCMPMTTKGKHSGYYLKIDALGKNIDSYIVINQGRVFDAQRFFTKIGKISAGEFAQIKKLLCCKYFPEVLEDFSPAMRRGRSPHT